MKKAINPITGIWFGALCTSFAATFIIASGEAPFVVAFYRLLFAVICLLPVNALQGWNQLRSMSREQLLSCFTAGLFFALHLVAYIASLQYTSVASAGALLSLQPVFTALGAFIFLRERIHFRVKLGIALAVLGGAVVGGGDLFIVTGSALFGDVLAALSALMISLYFVAGRSLRQYLDIVPYLIVVYGAAAISTAVISTFLGTSLVISTARGWIFLLALGLISTAVGHGIFNWALKYVKASTVALVTLASPALETVWAYIFLNQVPAITSIIGGIVMIIGAVLAVSGEKERGQRDV